MPTVSISGRWRFGLLLSLTTCFWWSILPITLAGVLPKMDPITLTFYRFFLAVLMLSPLIFAKRSALSFSPLKQPRVLVGVLMAGFMLTCNYGLYIFALERMSPSGAQLLIQVAPMLFLLSGVFLFKESFSRLQWLGVLIFGFGVLLFFHLRLSDIGSMVWPSLSETRVGQASEKNLSTNRDYLMGMVLMVFAAIFWAAYAIAQKQVAASLSALQLMLIINVIGAVLFFPFAQPAAAFTLTGFEGFLLFLCGLNTVIAYGCFSEALNHWEASRISATFAIVPLMTLGLVQLLKWFPIIEISPEPLDGIVVMGAAMVVLGAALASLASQKKVVN